jgi:signal transduction histidine kinase
MIRFNVISIFTFLLCLTNSILPQGIKQQIDSVNSISYEKIVSNLQYYIEVFNNNLNLARSINYTKGESLAMSNLALVYYLNGNYDKSTEFHLKAIELFEKNKMYHELSNEYGELGYQMKRRNLKKAIEYMQSAIFIAEKNQLEEFKISKLYDNYGVLKEMENQYDSAFYFYEKALSIKKSLNDSIGIPYSLNKIAVLYASLGNFNEAYKYLNLSDEYRNKEQDEYGRVENISFHGDFLVMQNKTDEAIQKFKEVYSKAKKNNYSYLVLYSLENLIKLYKSRNDYKQAVEMMELYSSLKDSIDNYQINSRIAQLEIAYETQKKDKIISENQFKIREKEQQLIFTIISLVLIVLIFTGVYRYQQLKKKKELTEIEYKAKISNAEMEKKLTEEKLRLSRELHDNIGSQLTFIISSLDNILFKDSLSDSKNSLNAIKDFGRNALDDLRNTIWAIKQKNGTVESLFLKVNELVSKLNESLSDVNIEMNNQIQNNFQLSSTQMINLFRIIQESIQNAIKHSGASSIKIIFKSDSSGFKLTVSDNGKGFNVDQTKSGNGILNMKKRCNEIGAEFNIDSNKSGTIIKCSLFTV